MTYNMQQILDEAESYLAKPKKAKTVDRYRRVCKSIALSGLNVIDYVAHVLFGAII